MPKQTRPFRQNSRTAPEPPPSPPGLTARLAAAAIVADVASGSHTLEERLGNETATGRLAELDPRDRSLVRSIATVSLRRLGTIRSALAKFLDKGLPRKAVGLEWTLTVAAAQILFLDVPDHAAVDLAIHAARRDPRCAPFAALSNAVLRNIVRSKEELVDPEDPFIDTPAWLAARWRKTFGNETALGIVRAHRQEPTLDLTVKSDPQSWAQRLGGIVLPNGSVRLSTRTAISELEGYEAGEWWVQDAAASLPARLLRARPGERIVDLCAAPGGKAAQLAQQGAEVVALDRSAERMKRLAANMARLGFDVDVSIGDVLNFDGGPYDGILLDAPCSSTGTIRRHPDVAWTKRASDIATLSAMQSKMLDRALSLLKPGGRLVYCTCSLEPEEGEVQISALLRRNPDVVRLPIEPQEVGGMSECITDSGDLRTLPTHLWTDDARLSGLDGFFAARLERR